MKSFHELSSMNGRRVVIAGGAGHIGLAAAETYAELGASVILLDLDADRAAAAAANIATRFNTEAECVAVNLETEVEVRRTAADLAARFEAIDVLVNAAALVSSMPLEGWTTPFERQSSTTWRRALEVNLTASFVLTQALIDPLRRSGRGSVINVASIYGMVGPDLSLYEGTAMGNAAGYAASKGGLLQLTRWLATVLAPDVRINALTPGGVWRDQPEAFHTRYKARTPLGRMGSEEDMKGAFAYLGSDLSGYVTGQNLVVDGGWTVW